MTIDLQKAGFKKLCEVQLEASVPSLLLGAMRVAVHDFARECHPHFVKYGWWYWMTKGAPDAHCSVADVEFGMHQCIDDARDQFRDLVQPAIVTVETGHFLVHIDKVENDKVTGVIALFANPIYDKE